MRSPPSISMLSFIPFLPSLSLRLGMLVAKLIQRAVAGTSDEFAVIGDALSSLPLEYANKNYRGERTISQVTQLAARRRNHACVSELLQLNEHPPPSPTSPLDRYTRQ